MLFRSIHGLAQRVLAAFGDPGIGRATPEHVVGVRRAITGDDVNVVPRAAALVDFPDENQQLGIHFRGLVLAPVPEEPVDLCQPPRIVNPVALERDRRLFSGMDEIEFQRLGRREGGRG